MALKAGVIVVQRQSGYKDVPGIRYHFPRAEYWNGVQALQDALLLLYEPRRRGTSMSSGGRMGFVALAYADKIYGDPADPTHAYLDYRYFCEFVRVVPLNRTSISPKSLQHAVRAVAYTEAEEVVRQGLFMEATPSGIHHGMTDTGILETVPQRETREVVSNRAIRDATFRYRVVEQAYKGRCAFTGSAEGHILTVDRGIDEPVLRMLPQDRRAYLPSHPDERPHEEFLRWHRANRFKGMTLATE